MTRVFDRLAMGFLIPARGLAVLTANQRIRRLAMLPFIFAVLIFIVGLALGLPFLTGIVPLFSGWLLGLSGLAATSAFYSIVSWLLPVLIWPVMIFALLYCLFIVTRVVGAPLYSLLAERVLIEQGVLPDAPFSLRSWVSAALRMFGIALSRGVLLAGIGSVLFILSFIPGFGIFTGFCFLVIVAFDVCDFALESLQMGLRDRLRFFRRNFAVFAGFGAALGLVFLIPGLNFFLFPASVAGASDMVRRLTTRAGSASR